MPDEILGLTLDAYAQTLCENCDLDLCPSDMVLTHDTWSYSDDHYFLPNNFQIPPIFGMKLWVGHDSGMHLLKVPTVILTFDLATCTIKHGSYTCHIVLS